MFKSFIWSKNHNFDIFASCFSFNSFCNVRYMVMPLMGADLNNIIKTQKLSDDHVQFLVYQIIRGMKYVHSAGIIHRFTNKYL